MDDLLPTYFMDDLLFYFAEFPYSFLSYCRSTGYYTCVGQSRFADEDSGFVGKNARELL